MKNMDVFNLIALEIFHQSLDTFPIPVNSSWAKVAESVKGYLEIVDEQAESQELLEQVMYTVWWLRDEQFIVLKRDTINGQFTASLTQKGLNAVNSSPSSLESKSSFKELFNKGLSNISSSVASGVMVEFFKASS